jgi:hypothetical protein
MGAASLAMARALRARDSPCRTSPLTLEEAARPLFRWEYKMLRARLKSLIAQGMPVVKDGRGYLLYPAHVEPWRISQYPADARRALRQGGYECSDAARSGIFATP